MHHFKSNEEFGYAGVRENFLSIHMTVESLLGFGIMQQRPPELGIRVPQASIVDGIASEITNGDWGYNRIQRVHARQENRSLACHIHYLKFLIKPHDVGA